MASSAVRRELPSSAVERSGLASPPVVVEEMEREKTVLPWMVPATPPPAMMARDQRRKGSSSVIKEAVMSVPAVTAAGVAILSRALSSQGT